jgi:uncharacterized Zn-binding protein involved in type VI secretion
LRTDRIFNVNKEKIMPNIALVGHHHTCPKHEPGPVPHVGGAVNKGQSACLVNGRPVAIVGDTCTCQVGGPDTIVTGSSSMTINGIPVAIVGSATAHGGVIVEGEPGLTVD